MKVVHSLSDPLPIERPVALTIGVYDGLHIGHQMIFKALRKESKKGYLSVVLTFSNHPSSYLTPQSHPPPFDFFRTSVAPSETVRSGCHNCPSF